MKLEPRLTLWYTTSNAANLWKKQQLLPLTTVTSSDLYSIHGYILSLYNRHVPSYSTHPVWCSVRKEKEQAHFVLLSAATRCGCLWLPAVLWQAWPRDTSSSMKEKHISSKEFKDIWFQKVSIFSCCFLCSLFLTVFMLLCK